jgi:ATP-dependent Clp protease adaptor protein ClpS
MSTEHPNDFDDLAIQEARPKLAKPPLYKVILLNDDYTPMEFVVVVLEKFFRMDHENATRIMLQVHQHGMAICGVFSREIAETKVQQVTEFSQENEHPLQCTMEPDE